MVRGTTENTEAIFKAAIKTVESLYEETYNSEDDTGKPVIKTKRKAKLKKPKEVTEEQAKKKQEQTKKQQEQSAYTASIPDPKTVIFEAMKEGPKRDPRPILPKNTDVTSPYALFSPFWTDEMWEILAKNTNLYAEQEEWEYQRPWYPMNVDEMRVYIGILIYMGLHHEGETAAFWHQDLRTGPNHTPALLMSLNRFTQLQRFIHISPLGAPPEPSADDV